MQIMLFAGIVAIVSGTIVSAVSVWLAPLQAENEKRDRQAVLQSMLACDPALATLLEAAIDGDASLDARGGRSPEDERKEARLASPR